MQGVCFCFGGDRLQVSVIVAGPRLGAALERMANARVVVQIPESEVERAAEIWADPCSVGRFSSRARLHWPQL